MSATIVETPFITEEERIAGAVGVIPTPYPLSWLSMITDSPVIVQAYYIRASAALDPMTGTWHSLTDPSNSFIDYLIRCNEPQITITEDAIVALTAWSDDKPAFTGSWDWIID